MSDCRFISIKEDQDQAYREMMLRVEREKIEAAKRAQEEAHKAKTFEQMWADFKAIQVPDSQAINIVFRMPNSSKVEQRFNKNDLIQRLYDFVRVCPTLGTPLGNTAFEVTQTFPRTVLDPKLRIADVFGDSDAELVNVFELA